MPVLPLSRGLAPLRRRLLALRRTSDAAWAVAAGATGAASGALIALTQGGDRAAAALAGALLLVVPAVLVQTVRHRLAPLDDLTVARWAESRAGWQERLTTALEHPTGGGPIGEALRRDARNHLELLDVERTAPWSWPAAPLTWIAGAAVVLAIAHTWPLPDRHGAAASDHAPGAVAALPPSAALRDLADEVAAEAARTDDVDLLALAAALRALADQAPVDDARRDELARVLAELTQRMGTELAAHDALQRAVRSDDAGAADAALAERDLDPNLRGVGASVPDYDDLFRRTEIWVDDEDPEPPSGPGGTPSSTEIVRPPLDPESLPGADFLPAAEGPAPSGGLAEIIGAADQSQAGDSVLAGHGSQALDGPASAPDLAATDTEAVLLVGIERDRGRRIEVELPPPAEWEAYEPATYAVGAWRARPESPVSSDPTPLRHHLAAGRYFLPTQETAASPGRPPRSAP